MKHLIIIHMVSRDKYWAEYIRRKIEAKSPDNEVRIITFDQIASRVIRENYRPDSILMYTLRDSLSVQRLTMLKLLTKARIIIYENEGLMDYDDLESVRTRIGITPRSTSLVDRYFYWGEKPARVSADLMMEKRFIRDKDVVSYCGYVNYEMKSEDIEPLLTEEEKELLNQVRKHCRGEKMVLALTGFPQADMTDEDFKADGEIITDDPEELHAFAESYRSNTAIFRDKYVRMIRKAAELHPEIPFVVKPHPAEYQQPRSREYYLGAFKDLPNVLFLDRAMIVGMLLKDTRLLIHYGSTVALEAYIRGIPTLIYEDESYIGNRELMESTKIVRGEVDGHVLDGTAFHRLPGNDAFIYDLFNYRPDRDYQPSEDLIRAMENRADGYPFSKKDLLAPVPKEGITHPLFWEWRACLKKGDLKGLYRFFMALLKVA